MSKVMVQMLGLDQSWKFPSLSTEIWEVSSQCVSCGASLCPSKCIFWLLRPPPRHNCPPVSYLSGRWCTPGRCGKVYISNLIYRWAPPVLPIRLLSSPISLWAEWSLKYLHTSNGLWDEGRGGEKNPPYSRFVYFVWLLDEDMPMGCVVVVLAGCCTYLPPTCCSFLWLIGAPLTRSTNTHAEYGICSSSVLCVASWKMCARAGRFFFCKRG